ncbi:hypothetical protein HUG10_17720 [Halorarum halophilum]|uniref:D-glucuronyl C5-epimerase C-terminal domain-containing protein n=1 Tax=Halorarum halophilum TaxID=2743090 RepID=A0A7D5KHL7_9EURY|nr:D-glucuronyl C5-epimerase family protein [Halobaculum halophilum]QLG29256.1 hypothetical protein HUG10_17720 [Halobaculum halophilum]
MAAPSDDDSSADSRRRFLALATAVGLTGCTGFEGHSSSAAEASTPTPSPPSTPSPTPTPSQPRIGNVPVQRRRYSLRELPYEKRPQFFGPYRQSEPKCSYPVEAVQDIDNLRMAEVDGQTGHFPLRTARWLLRLLHCYRVTGDDGFLSKAEEMSGAFLADATKVEDGGIYFPYGIDKSGSSASMEAPWYSGMCQGVALSAYTYFHELTDDDEHLETADRVLETFTTLARDTDGPWTSMVDPDGHYWVEEYPADPPTHVFNGYCVGLWGLYDYWMHVRSERSRLLLEAALTTLEHSLEYIRAPNDVSYYGLDGYFYWERGMTETYPARPYRGNAAYHEVHVAQIDKLYEISGAEHFREMRETFESDHPVDERE